jgi:hypothetical protein
MLRKTIITLFAVVAVGLVSPSIASAAHQRTSKVTSHGTSHHRTSHGGRGIGYGGGGYDDGYGGGYGGYYGPSYGFGPCLPVPVPIVGCW